MDGLQEGRRRQHQDCGQFHEQNAQLHRPAEPADGRDEVSQDRHPADERDKLTAQLEGRSDTAHDGHQLGSRPEAHRNEGQAQLRSQRRETSLRGEDRGLSKRILNKMCLSFILIKINFILFL